LSSKLDAESSNLGSQGSNSDATGDTPIVHLADRLTDRSVDPRGGGRADRHRMRKWQR
jgi:hypothetical protein